MTKSRPVPIGPRPTSRADERLGSVSCAHGPSLARIVHQRSGSGTWPAWDQEISRIDLHGFLVLVECRGAHPDQASIGSRLRMSHFEDLARCVQFVAWAYRTRPAQFVEAHAQDAACRPELSLDQKAHGDCGGVPATRREAAKDRLGRGLLVEMIGLRIELRGKSFDLFPVDPQPAGGKDLACGEVLKIEFVHFLSDCGSVLGVFIGRGPGAACDRGCIDQPEGSKRYAQCNKDGSQIAGKDPLPRRREPKFIDAGHWTLPP